MEPAQCRVLTMEGLLTEALLAMGNRPSRPRFPRASRTSDGLTFYGWPVTPGPGNMPTGLVGSAETGR